MSLKVFITKSSSMNIYLCVCVCLNVLKTVFETKLNRSRLRFLNVFPISIERNKLYVIFNYNKYSIVEGGK